MLSPVTGSIRKMFLTKKVAIVNFIGKAQHEKDRFERYLL
jgi:hypothetical protein